MQRLSLVLASIVPLLAAGCSGKYESRMEATLKQREDEMKLDKNVDAAPNEGPFRENNIYVRPPRPMKLSGEAPPGVPQGAFDVDKTFADPGKSSLTVLARVKKASTAKAAKNVPTRRPFNEEVFSFVRSNYGEDENLVPEKLKDARHKDNPFKRVFTKTAAGKAVEVYVYRVGNDDVALIFQCDAADQATIEKFKYTLDSFAVGQVALRKFSNNGSESGATAAAEPGATF